MGHREGSSRMKPIRLNLEEHIAQDNPARLIDAYVDSLDLEELGFSHVAPEETGRPPYHPGDLLKLHIYGYLHRMRSSRQLAWACEVNIELWWLLQPEAYYACPVAAAYRGLYLAYRGQLSASEGFISHFGPLLHGGGPRCEMRNFKSLPALARHGAP